MKKVIAFSVALLIALVGFQMSVVKVHAAEKVTTISQLNDEPAPPPAPAPGGEEKKAKKKKRGKKKTG